MSIWKPFTTDAIGKFLQEFGDRIGSRVTVGCEECEHHQRCCSECYDEKMSSRVTRLAKQLRNYRNLNKSTSPEDADAFLSGLCDNDGGK